MAILALVDCETTGLDPIVHELIEIGLVVFDSRNGHILDEWDIKIKPERPDDGDVAAYACNGYDPVEWESATTLEDAMQQLVERTDGATMMAFNITFDLGFLQAAFKKTGIVDKMARLHLDLLTIAWMKIPHSRMQRWSLRNVCTYLGIKPEPIVHRGGNGARKGWEVYKALMDI